MCDVINKTASLVKLDDNTDFDIPGGADKLKKSLNAAEIPKYLLNRNRQLYFLKLVKEFGVGQHGRILDFGCGAGDLVISRRLLGFNAYGVDINENNISTC